MENNLLCTVSWSPHWLIFTSQAPMLLYYAHIPTALVSLFFGFFVYFKNRNLLSKILLFITIFFSLWLFLNLVIWVGEDSMIMMFFWSFFGILYALIYLLSFYFVYVYIEKKDISLRKKIFFILPILPIIFLSSLKYNLAGFDVVNCEAIEARGYLSYYHFFGVAIFLGILIFSFIKYRKSAKENRKQILLLTFGIELFLLSFFTTGYIASILDNFELEQYGLFGMTFFIGVLAYMIVKFKAFNIKLLGAQALVVGLVILIGSQYFFIQNSTNKILNGITLFLAVVFGWWLIQSVKEEVRRKEELEKLTKQLAAANARLKQLDKAKTEFLSIASHQLRAPLTAVKGFASLMLDGSYGEVSGEQKDVLKKIFDSNERLVALTENLLNISRIEAGRMAFNFGSNNIEELAGEVVSEMKNNADKKDIYLHYEKPAQPIRPFIFDKNKMHEVIMNLIDNAVKYTFEGGVTVKLEDTPDKLRLVVSDTGIGISQEGLKNISTKFYRTENARRSQSDGTGIGVYVVRKILEAHQANLTIFSQGEGQGSVFAVELDKNFKPENEE